MAATGLLIYEHNKGKNNQSNQTNENKTGLFEKGKSYYTEDITNSENYKKLLPYVIKELDKGYSIHQIKKALINAGWQKKIVKSVIKVIQSQIDKNKRGG